MVLPALKQRRQAALEELDRLLEDRKDFPINYNHYFTDTVHKKRQERIQSQLGHHASTEMYASAGMISRADIPSIIEETVSSWGKSVTADMEQFSCEEALDSLLAIYKVRHRFLYILRK